MMHPHAHPSGWRYLTLRGCLISVTLCKLNWLAKYVVYPRQIKLIAFNREVRKVAMESETRSYLYPASELIKSDIVRHRWQWGRCVPTHSFTADWDDDA